MDRTKGKWVVDKPNSMVAIMKDDVYCYVCECAGEYIHLPHKEEMANAEFICKAVNAHSQLVEAIKFAYKTADKAIRVGGEPHSACNYIAIRLAHELQELAALEAAGE